MNINRADFEWVKAHFFSRPKLTVLIAAGKVTGSIVNAVADDGRNESMLSIVFADVCAETLPQSLFELDLGLKIESGKASRGSKRRTTGRD